MPKLDPNSFLSNNENIIDIYTMEAIASSKLLLNAKEIGVFGKLQENKFHLL
jgi:hypothetical protein